MPLSTVQDINGDTLKCTQFRGKNYPIRPGYDLDLILTNLPDLSLRDDDVTIVAYPKSGTHWVWEMCNMVLNKTLEIPAKSKMNTMIDVLSQEELHKVQPYRILNTHVTPELYPKDLIKRKSKIIYVYRNPKDVFVSFFHHVSKLKTFDYSGKWDGFFQLVLSGKDMRCQICGTNFTSRDVLKEHMRRIHQHNAYICFVCEKSFSRKGDLSRHETIHSRHRSTDQRTGTYGSWFDFTKTWEEFFGSNEDIPVLRLCFETMKKDPLEAVNQIAQFLNVERDEAFLNMVCEKSSFDNMKRGRKLNDMMSSLVKQQFHPIFRKGIIGDWKNYFTVAQNERFDQEYKTQMNAMAFEFDKYM